MSAIVSFGANLNIPKKTIEQALSIITKEDSLICKSSYYQTAPWGFKSNNSFINCVAEFNTKKDPYELLEFYKTIEIKLGRIKKSNTLSYVDRAIDIDILFYKNEVINKKNLKIPHYHLANRRFILIPLNEIKPQFIHPILKKTITHLLINCPDTSKVIKV